MTNNQGFSYQGPLYEQVYKSLRGRILAGEWELREPLPGEAWLSRELGVSVGTVRKAMDQLTRESIVVRERGRGTFVRQDAEWRTHSAFRLSDREGAPITCEIRLTDYRMAIATQAEAADLRVRSRAKGPVSVLRLQRDWLSGGQTLCRETIVVEAARFPSLREEIDETAETLFATYAQNYRQTVDRIQWDIGSPAPADDLPPADRSLVIKRIAMDARGIPVETCEQKIVLGGCIVQISR